MKAENVTVNMRRYACSKSSVCFKAALSLEDEKCRKNVRLTNCFAPATSLGSEVM